MKSFKPFAVLFALTFIVLTAAQAQTSTAAQWKQRVADQIATGLTQPATPATPAAAPAGRVSEEAERAATRSSDAEPGDAEARQESLRDHRSQRQNALVGTWDLVLTFSDGSKVKSTLTVIPGRRDGEGSVIHAAEATLLKPNPTTPEQGTWENRGGQRFVASYVGYAVDEKFEAPAGKIGFKHSIRVSGDQESFVGRAVFEVRDPEGNVVFSDHIETHGTRQHPDAP